jgi:hypothetical protein
MVLSARIFSIENWGIAPDQQRRYALKLLVISFALLTANGAFFFHERYSYNGFFYATSVPSLIAADIPHIDSYFYQSFPASPFYVLELQQITGISVETIIYLPVLLVIPLLWYFVLAREALQNDLLAILLAISVVAYFGGKIVHYSEYPTGLLVYPLFLFVGYRMLTTGQHRYVALTATLLGMLWGFAPHGQVRAASFIAIAAVAFVAYQAVFLSRGQHRADGGESANTAPVLLGMKPRRIAIFSVAAAVFLFWFTGKFYQGFIGRLNTALTSPLAPITEFLAGSSEASIMYGESPHLAELVQSINTTYVLLTGVSLAVGGIVVVGIGARYGQEYIRDSVHELILGIGILSYLPDMGMMLLMGRFQLSIVRELGPILPLGILLSTINRLHPSTAKRVLRRGLIGVVIIFFLLGVTSQVAFLATESPTETPSNAQTTALGYWLVDYQEEGKVLTDLNSLGYARAAVAKITDKPRPVNTVRYTDTRYAYLIGDNVSAAVPTPEVQAQFGTPNPPERFEYILLNWATPNEPLKRGSPDWRSFEALGKYKIEIRTNPRINRIFTTGEYTAERPVGKNESDMERYIQKCKH